MDPASLQVLISRLTGIAEEMGAVLRRAAYSPNIKERADCSAALFTASGELLVQAEHIPVHLGSMPASVAAAITAFPKVKPGQQIVLNDPFAGGTHLNDVTFVAPCFVGDRLVGWAANRAHHADLGGMTPGSIPPDAVEIHQEGLRIPPVLLSRAVVAMMCANSRTPMERRGDIDAQIGANVVGVQRLAELVSSLGLEGEGERGQAAGSVPAAFDEVLSYGERRMRAALSDMADGEWSFWDVLDSSGPRESQQAPVRIALTVRVAGDSIEFDFAGSDPQRPGNVNAVEAVTVSSVAFALRSVLDASMPSNGGTMRPVRVVVPPGSVVGAVAPAAVGAGNVEVSQRVADVCSGALAEALPGRVGAASQGTMNNVMIGGAGSGAGWVYYETVAGGQGGRPRADAGAAGMSGVHTGMTNTKNTPVEAFERAFPMRVRRYALRRGSGGSGAAAGGDGIEREIEVLEDCTVSLITERRRSRPWGLDGGEPGAVGENWLLPAGGGEPVPLPDKCTVELRPGDVIRLLTPGGGGCGTPDAPTPGAPTPRDHP